MITPLIIVDHVNDSRRGGRKGRIGEHWILLILYDDNLIKVSFCTFEWLTCGRNPSCTLKSIELLRSVETSMHRN